MCIEQRVNPSQGTSAELLGWAASRSVHPTAAHPAVATAFHSNRLPFPHERGLSQSRTNVFFPPLVTTQIGPCTGHCDLFHSNIQTNY